MLKAKDIEVRFNDCDMMGHVNNAIYLTYIEEARIHFFNQILPKNWDWKKNGIIVKKHEIVYHLPILLGDQIKIETKIGEIKTRSFELIHILQVNSKEVTSIKSILVYYDYFKNESKELDQFILKLLNHA